MSGSAARPVLDLVICTYNNAPLLDRALSAIARQPRDAGVRWSCLVVDNNCTDDTAAVVARHARESGIPGLRRVVETDQGLTPARLRGLRETSGEWIAFVDDDCLLGEGWIEAAARFVATQPAAGAFGGRVVLAWESEPPVWVRRFGYAFAEQEHGPDLQPVPFLVGAGLVLRRAALQQTGWPDGPLLADRIGRRLISGGDVEIVLRVRAAGHPLWYVPACELRHSIPAHRTTLRYLLAVNLGLGVSQALADALVWRGGTAGWFARVTLDWLRSAGAMSRVLVDVARGRVKLAEFLIQDCFQLGRARGIARILLMRPSRRRALLGRAA